MISITRYLASYTHKGAGGSEGARARVDRAAQVRMSGGCAHSGDCLNRATPVPSSGLGQTVCLSLNAIFGAWLADVNIRCGLRLCCSHRSSGDWRAGVSPHHTMAGGDVGGRVTDGADSPAAAGWSDRARAVALKPLPGWFRLRLQTWVALATTNGQARE